MKKYIWLFLAITGLSGCDKAPEEASVREREFSTKGKKIKVGEFSGGCRVFYVKDNDFSRCSMIFVFDTDLHRKFLENISYGFETIDSPFGDFKMYESLNGFMLFRKGEGGKVESKKVEISRKIDTSLVVASFEDPQFGSLEESDLWSEIEPEEAKNIQEFLVGREGEKR